MKGHSYDSYSTYIEIFSSFLQVVYPVGVTDLRPYFTQRIGHNSMNVHWIPTKPWYWDLPSLALYVYKFQLDRSTHLHFMADL